MIERRSFIQGDQMINQIIEDETDLLEDNKAEKNAQSDNFKYLNGKLLFKAASVSMVMIEKMANGQCCSDGITYKFLTNDKDEKKRALLHIQGSHAEYLTVEGKPFAKQKQAWI